MPTEKGHFSLSDRKGEGKSLSKKKEGRRKVSRTVRERRRKKKSNFHVGIRREQDSPHRKNAFWGGGMDRYQPFLRKKKSLTDQEAGGSAASSRSILEGVN